MSRILLGVVLTAFLATTARGDSIDDAEAKRRGVPVSQVQAENALAKEKAKTTALESQIAALQKQLSELQKQSGAPAAGDAGAGGGVATSGVVASGPAAAGGAAGATAAVAWPADVPAGVDDGQAHLVKMYRIPVVEAYQTHITAEYSLSEHRTTLSGQESSGGLSLKADAKGKLNIQKVVNGLPTQMALQVGSFLVNGQQVMANGTVLIQSEPGKVAYGAPGNGELNAPVLQALDVLYPKPGPSVINEDDAVGSKVAHKVNEEWAIDGTLAAQQLSEFSRMVLGQGGSQIELDPAHVTGKAKIAGVETVGGVKALRVIVVVDATDMKPHAGYTVESCQVHAVINRLVPVAPAGRLLENSMKMDVALVETSGTLGKFESKVHLERGDVNTGK